jgi:hypothetical protein
MFTTSIFLVDAKKSAKEKDELVFACILCKKTIKGNSSCIACDSCQQGLI